MKQTANTDQSSGIRTEKSISDVVLVKLDKTQFQKKGTITAQIKQTILVQTSYPSAKVASNSQQNLFDVSNFGFTAQTFDSTENRVAFIPVPEGSSEAEVNLKLEQANKNGATIYKVLSNKPILDDNQQRGIDAGLTTLDKIADTQVVRYPVGHQAEGQIIKDGQGKVQYRKTYFWATFKEDIDLRSSDPANVYITPKVKAELSGASVMEGQTI